MHSASILFHDREKKTTPIVISIVPWLLRGEYSLAERFFNPQLLILFRSKFGRMKPLLYGESNGANFIQKGLHPVDC